MKYQNEFEAYYAFPEGISVGADGKYRCVQARAAYAAFASQQEVIDSLTGNPASNHAEQHLEMVGREAFEIFAKHNGYSLQIVKGLESYTEVATQVAWEVWQARDAINQSLNTAPVYVLFVHGKPVAASDVPFVLPEYGDNSALTQHEVTL